MRLLRLTASEAALASEFCAKHPYESLFIAGWIADGGLEENPQTSRGWLFSDGIPGGPLHGLVFISETGIVVPVLEREVGIHSLSELARQNAQAFRVLVGERGLVDELWRRLQVFGLTARLNRAQRGLATDRAAFRPTDDLRLICADDDHLEEIVTASAAMAREEAGDDPQARNPKLFHQRIGERVARGRDFVYLERDTLVFKTNVAAISEVGGQVEGIYTMPNSRRQGLGRRGTSTITDWVLERSPRAFLLVNDDNDGALRLYEGLGYREVMESRTIFVD